MTRYARYLILGVLALILCASLGSILIYRELAPGTGHPMPLPPVPASQSSSVSAPLDSSVRVFHQEPAHDDPWDQIVIPIYY